MGRPIEIRSVHVREKEAILELQDNERVVGVDHEGNDFWIYIERTLDGREEG